MSVPHPPSAVSGRSSRRLIGAASLAAALAAAACLAPERDRLTAADPPAAGGAPKETLVGGLPLFAGWPKGQKPDAVIVFSGQTWGYLQPCGCSRPQTGGLERRAYFIDQLKAKGWPVAAVDLGDVYPDKSPDKPLLREQGKLKYVATMNALREMGYLAVGVGKTELQGDLFDILSSYALQKEQRPFTLAGNAVAPGPPGQPPTPRVQAFPPGGGGNRPMVEQIEVAKVGDVSVGIAGVVGKALQQDNLKNKWSPMVDFPNAKAAIKDAVAALGKHPLKPQVNVLIFQGPSGDAAKVALDFPQFQVILCRADDDLPPLQPQVVNGKNGEKTLIVQVGHKGQHVGVLGAFKKPGGFDFKYQLVPLGEEFNTPGTEAEALQKNQAIQALEAYAKSVKDAKLLTKYPRVLHAAQIQAATTLKPPVDLTYVGSDACKACHAAEYNKWKTVPHSHAMDTLVKVAKRPSLREFDGECVKCHTVGFEYKSGAYDPKNNAAQNVALHHVGCENCHGPGSGHVDAPKRKDLLELMSPWKQPGAPKLPNKAFMEKMANIPPADRGKEAIAPAQQLLLNLVSRTCTHCHDHEADPHFDLYKNWPKIDHSGLAPAGGWPAVAPKK